jgi:small acid-soluble spore protein D (minor alpha/beta-type SASP)
LSTRNRLLVPDARQAMNTFKTNVMNKNGFPTTDPSQVKYEVANQLGIPLEKGYNGKIQAKDAGLIGGKIGGSMVSELIQMAKQNLK